MKVLELFSGYECISNAFREKGHECYTIDWDKKFHSSMHTDIAELEIEDLPEKFQHPDVVFCGTDCTTYSVAAISRHRRKNPITGNLDPISDKARRADATTPDASRCGTRVAARSVSTALSISNVASSTFRRSSSGSNTIRTAPPSSLS